MGANIGWLFYKDYFKDLNYNDLKDRQNERKIQQTVQNILEQSIVLQKDDEWLGNTHFKATTTYPGLLLGSGNAHELPSVEGQAVLGFSFDYTSGLPVIAGSSIKGVLRSAFRHWEYIAELISLKTKQDIEDLETEIFDNGDIFFDATVVSQGKILADDYLCPHGDDSLKNPIPLRFIKVAPNVNFRFDFELGDGLISKMQKAQLFQTLLEDIGLGAKTNVGYGKFESFSTEKTPEERAREQEENEKNKEREREQKEQHQARLKLQKEQAAEDGLSKLKTCKTLKEGLVILKQSFTNAKPKLTDEQKEIVYSFAKRVEKQSKPKELKALKKYGVDL